MSRGLSVLTQVGGLAVTALVAAILISFGVVLATPAPEPARMSAADAVAGLRGTLRSGLERFYSRAPPAGRETGLMARAVADGLGVPRDRVRAAWAGSPGLGSDAPAAGQTVALVAGQEVVIDSREGGFLMRSGGGVSVSQTASVPPFEAGVRQADGGWLLVRPADPLLASWRLRMLAAFLLGLALLAPLVWLVARRLTRPIRRLAEGAERMRLWLDDAVIPVGGPREVRAAARAINAMRDRIAGEAAGRTRMLAAVAHDLRNPLTGLRLRAESAAEPERSRMIADIGRMEAMIAQVLDYARDREVGEACVALDVSALMRACAEEAAERRDAVTLLDPPGPIFVEAQPESLRRALVNLIDNALRYAGEAVLAVERSGGIMLIVDDNGGGIPSAELGRLTEPFERLEASRSRETGGAGLGLAIARGVAERHGGRLLLENRPGGGLRAAICLPDGAPRVPPDDRKARRRSDPS